MKKVSIATLLVLAVVAVFGAGKVSQIQVLHNVGKIMPINVPEQQPGATLPPLSPSDVLTRLKAGGLKANSVGGSAHFDDNHLYVNTGNWMHLVGCQVDPRPGAGIFLNSSGAVAVVHYAKANSMILVDFIITNPTGQTTIARTSTHGSTPQNWTITRPTHVPVVAVASADGKYQFDLFATQGVVQLTGADVSDANP